MGIARSTYYGAPAADRDRDVASSRRSARSSRPTVTRVGHQGQLVNSKRGDGEARGVAKQEGATHYNGQRPRRADHPQLGGRHGPRWTQPAVGGGHHLRRHCDRLPLPRRDPRCLVTEEREPVSPSRRSTRRFAHGRLPRAACITATAVRNTRLSPTGSCLPSTSSRARWGRRGNPYDNAKAESFMRPETGAVFALWPHCPSKIEARWPDAHRCLTTCQCGWAGLPSTRTRCPRKELCRSRPGP